MRPPNLQITGDWTYIWEMASVSTELISRFITINPSNTKQCAICGSNVNQCRPPLSVSLFLFIVAFCTQQKLQLHIIAEVLSFSFFSFFLCSDKAKKERHPILSFQNKILESCSCCSAAKTTDCLLLPRKIEKH